MNDQEMGSDVGEAALQAWDREHRAKKRRLALVVAVALAVGFAGAAIAGRSQRAQSQEAHATNGVVR